MVFRFYLWVALLFANNSWADVPEYVKKFRKNFIEQSLKIAEEMAEKYPPDRFHVLNFSRASNVIMEALRFIGGESYSIDRPINGFSSIHDLTPEEQDRVLRNLIPLEEIRGKKLVILRPLWAGRSMSSAFELFLDFSERHDLEIPHMHLIHKDSDVSNFSRLDIVDGFFKNVMPISFVENEEFWRMTRNELKDDMEDLIIHFSRYESRRIFDLKSRDGVEWEKGRNLSELIALINESSLTCLGRTLSLL